MRKTFLICAATMTLFLTGCPDYSHLREEPDYKNMTDSGEEPVEVPSKDAAKE